MNLFVDLEVEAWEAGKDQTTRNVTSGRFTGDHLARRAAARAWGRIAQQQHLTQAIADLRQAEAALAAAVGAAAIIPAGTTAAVIREDVPAQRAILQLRGTFGTSLQALRQARADEAAGQMQRTVNYLESLQDANRAAEATLEAALDPPAAIRAAWNQVAALNGPLVEPPEDGEAFLGIIRRRLQLLEARITYSESLRLHEVDEEFGNDNGAQCDVLVEQFERLLEVASERAERHKIDPKADLPAPDNTEAVTAYRALVTIASRSLEAVDILQKTLIDIYTNQLERSADNEKQIARDRLQRANEACRTSIAATRKGARSLESLVRTAQSGALRLSHGQLGSGWVLIQRAGQGGFGTADIWAKQNHTGVIIDRVVVKDTKTGYSHEDGWSGPGKEPPSRPLEVDTMYRIQEAKLPGHENVVRILNWRLDPDRNAYEKEKANRGEEPRREWTKDCFRIYVEWCGHDDLKRLVVLDPEATIPEPFLWSVFLALTNACGAMEGHRLDEESDVTATIVHNDLKLENVFLGENTSNTYVRWPVAKVGDFGLARWHKQDDPPDHADRFRGTGTTCNMPPEQARVQNRDLQPNWTHDTPDSRSNVWGIGNVIWSVMHGMSGDPRIGRWHAFIPQLGLFPVFAPAKRAIYSDELISLIERCLEYYSQQRISLRELREELEDALDGPNPRDEGLKHAEPNDPQWAPNLFKLHQDYARIGFVLHDVRDRSGNKVFANRTDLGPLPPRAASGEPIPDDPDERPGAKLSWPPGDLENNYSFNLDPKSPDAEQSHLPAQAPAAGNTTQGNNAVGENASNDHEDRSFVTNSPRWTPQSSENVHQTGVRGRISGGRALSNSQHRTAGSKRARSHENDGHDSLGQRKSPRSA